MFHCNDEGLLKDAVEAFYSGVTIGPKEPRARRLVHEVVMPG